MLRHLTTLEIHPQLPDDLALDDVAEDVLLDVSFARLMTFTDVVSWLFSQRTPKPPLTSV